MIDWREETPRMSMRDRMDFSELFMQKPVIKPQPEDEPLHPDGMTCIQCRHFDRCRNIIGALAEWDTCDFSPSKFSEAAIRL